MSKPLLDFEQIKILFIIMLVLSMAHCLEIGADSVVSVDYGVNAGYGQSNFPQIVLGVPMGAGGGQGSLDVLSLGDAGEIILMFEDEIMVDGPGPDLAVFENPFFIGGDSNNIFLEVGFVEISADGNSFIPCPYTFDSTIQPVGNPARYQRLAGVWPVNSNNGIPDPRNPDSSGGDFFDLAEIGLENARFVRIIDAGDSIYDGGWSSPPSAGFDLDAIVAIHWTDANNPFIITNAKAVSDTEVVVSFSKTLAFNASFPLEYFKLDGVPLLSGDTILISDTTTLILVLRQTPLLENTMPILTVSQYIESQTGENLLNHYNKMIKKGSGQNSIMAYPNPACSRVMFSIILQDTGTYTIDIFNIAGQKVHTINSSSLQISWEPEVGAGCYFCRLKKGEENAFCKIVLLK
ncbi:T9SS type A sorting domain-containing protein [candidate division WOR-3 bacterium]|nr:T9SS type A sorting domain-containing protein [candidate division WOR-3 bacterium]